METQKTNKQIQAEKNLSIISRSDNPLGRSRILVHEVLIIIPVIPVVSVYQLRQEEILKAVFG